jgi:diketogulonate reductase-like aldo/keto reductase
MNTLTLNNGVTMPSLGFSVFQNPPEEQGFGAVA